MNNILYNFVELIYKINSKVYKLLINIKLLYTKLLINIKLLSTNY